MNEKEKKGGDWKMIAGGIALIVVLFVGIEFIFWGLEQAIPRRPADGSPNVSVSQDASAGNGEPEEAPSFCVHCGKGLPESFEWGQFCPWCGEKVE